MLSSFTQLTNDISTIPESFKAVDQTSQVTVLYFVAKWQVVMYIVTNFIINSEFDCNDVNMIVYNLYSKSINSKRNGASRRGTGKSCPTVRHGLRRYKEPQKMSYIALLIWNLYRSLRYICGTLKYFVKWLSMS